MPILGNKEQVAEAEAAKPTSLLRLLLIGDTKAGKTRYAIQAVKAGYYVVLVDGDVALPTINAMAADGALTQEEMSRIVYLGVHDYQDDKGNYVTNFADFWKDFSTDRRFVWNDTLGQKFSSARYEPNHRVWEIMPSKFDGKVVLIFDSWSAYVQSVMQWKADSISEDLAEIEKIGRDVYAGVGNKLTQSIVLLTALRCHVIVIAHPDEYVKMSNPKGVSQGQKEKNAVIEWTKMVPKSSSRPHALTMGKAFSDIAWIDVTASRKRMIDFTPTDSRVVGGSYNDKAEVESRPIGDVIKKIGGNPIGADMDSWLVQHGPGEYQPANKRPAPVLQKANADSPGEGAAPTKIALGGGLAGMLNKPKA